MKNLLNRVAIRRFILVSIFVSSAAAQAMPASRAQEHTRVSNPDAILIEVLGRGLLYSINYDRVMNDDMSAGFGFGSVSTNYPNSGTSAGQTAIQIPVYFNYYFTRTQGSIYGTAGLNVVTNSSSVRGLDASTSNVNFPQNTIMPTFGIGYENRGDTGYLFRVAGYGIAGSKIKPWIGISFGIAF